MRLRALAATVVLGTTIAVPARAERLVYPDQFVPDSAAISAGTAAFVAAIVPLNGFLAASARLAAARAGSRIRAYAKREGAGREAAIDEVRAWAEGIKRARVSEAEAPTIDRLGPIFGLLNDPVDVVAVPPDAPQRADLAALARLDGAAFDALYASAQAATLGEIERNYVDYIKNGDDQLLRALGVRDLGRVRALIAALPRR